MRKEPWIGWDYPGLEAGGFWLMFLVAAFCDPAVWSRVCHGTELTHIITHLVALSQLPFGKKPALIYPRIIAQFNETWPLSCSSFFNCSYWGQACLRVGWAGFNAAFAQTCGMKCWWQSVWVGEWRWTTLKKAQFGEIDNLNLDTNSTYCWTKYHSFVCNSAFTTHVLKIKHMLKCFARGGLQSSISTVCFCSKFTVIVSHWIDAHWVRYKKSMGTKGPSIWDFDPHIIQIHNDCFDLWIYNSIEAFQRLLKTFQLQSMLEGDTRAPAWIRWIKFSCLFAAEITSQIAG